MESPLQTIECLQQQVRDLEAQLAAAQRGVQPFGYVNTHTGQFFTDVEPCRRNNEGHWRTVYTHPTTQGLDAQQLYSEIMNIKAVAHIFIHEQRAYKEGHRDARHAAAELVLAAQAKQAGV